MKSIIFVVPKLGIGGVERSLLSLLQQMPPEKFSVTVLTFVAGGELEALLPKEITVRHAPDARRQESCRAMLSGMLRKVGGGALFHFAKRVYHKFGKLMFRRTVQAEHFDIAIAYSDGLATWYTSQRINADIKLAFVHTDMLSAGYDAAQERTVYAAYDRIFFSSQAVRNAFLKLLPDQNHKTAILPNGIDTTEILRLSREMNPYPKREEIRLLTVGRLSHEKGVDKIPLLLHMLLDAGEKVHWYIVGNGPELENLRRSAANLGVENALTLTGSQKNPYTYMRGCDVYVQPSNYEGYCIALAEARVLCVPIVTCSFSGASEQLTNGKNGFITGSDIDDLFPAILELVRSREKREAFSLALHKELSALQTDNTIQKWWNWLETI